MLAAILVIALVLPQALGCSVTSSATYSSSSSVVAKKTVFIAQATSDCKVSLKSSVSLTKLKAVYATVGGVAHAVANNEDVSQVSWVVDHSDASSGSYVVNFYDAAAFTSLSEGKTTSPSFTVTVSHKNASSIKLPFKTEFLALVLLFAAVYYSIFVFPSQSFATSQ